MFLTMFVLPKHDKNSMELDDDHLPELLLDDMIDSSPVECTNLTLGDDTSTVNSSTECSTPQLNWM